MRKTTKTLIGNEALKALKRGIDQVAAPVTATIGAAGRNGVFQEFNKPSITNDGVTIARQIMPADPFEAMGADLIRDAAERTNEEAGDGTTTSIVLAHALIEKGMAKIEAGYNSMVLRRELEDAKNEVVALIKDASKPIKTKDELFDIAKISVEDDEVASIITEARHRIGAIGVIIVDEGVGYTIEKEDVEGYFYDKGYISPYMITQDNGDAILEDCPVIITDKYLNLNKELVGLLDQLIKQGQNKCLIIADNIEGELLQSLVVNKLKGNFTAVAVRRPASLEELEDIATVTGATAVTDAKGIKVIGIEHVGKARKVVVKKNMTIIIGKDFPALKERISNLDIEIEQETTNLYRQADLKERRAKLTGSIVLMKVGAKTETERKYLKRKVDDAVCATKAALEEGIVAGAGSTLNEISKKMKKETVGAQILAEALTFPREKILKNAGIKDDGKDYDVLTGKVVKDLRKHGIIDPAKVERCAVENAVSVAKNILTLESAIAEIEKVEKRILDNQ